MAYGIVDFYLIKCPPSKFVWVGFASPWGFHFTPQKVRANPTLKKIYIYTTLFGFRKPRWKIDFELHMVRHFTQEGQAGDQNNGRSDTGCLVRNLFASSMHRPVLDIVTLRLYKSVREGNLMVARA